MRSIDRRLLLAVLVICGTVLATGVAAEEVTVEITETADIGSTTGTFDSQADEAGLTVDLSLENSTNETLTATLISETSGATQAYLRHDNGTLIDSTSISNRQAEFDIQNIDSGTYHITADNGGNSWDIGYKSNTVTSFPYDSEKETVSITSGYRDGTTENALTYRNVSVTYDTTAHTPEINNSSATPTGDELVQESPVELSINASDADFGTSQGDSVNVTFYDASDDSEIGTDTLTANGTATTDWSSVVGGDNDWYAVATDSYGNKVTSQTFTFQAPATLELRNESDPDNIVTTNASAEVTFFAGEQVITRETIDGTIDMTGLPIGETFIVQVRADGYVTRQAVIESITEQQEIYLLPGSVDSVETRFLLDDPTGQFSPSNTRVTVKKPITRNGSTVYRTVVADILGEGGYTTVLERDQRYLLEVKDTESGNTRTLGPYVATSSETVTLRISALQFDSVETDLGYSWGSEYKNGSEPSVKFSWGSEPETNVEDLTVTITQKGGNETVILDETYVEPETFSETAIIPDSVAEPSSSTWLVEWQATIDGDTVRGSSVVGPSQLPVDMPGMSDDVLSMISVFLVLMVGGLFSTANVTVGGIVTSLFSGALWFVGVMPDAVSGLMIAAALFISIMAHARTNQEVRPT